MKKYLWVGIALLFMSLNASDNPFDLKENFGKLENSQDMMLLELRKVAEARELAEDEEIDSTPVEENKEELVKSLSAKNDNAVVENTKSKITENVNAEKEKQALLEKVKQKEAEIQKIKAEAEKREVEAYEKQRADKLAQQAKEEAAALEREALAQKEAKEKRLAEEERLKKEKRLEKEKKEAEEKNMKEQLLEAVKSIDIVSPVQVEKTEEIVKEEVITPKIITSIDDINITREREEAKVAADQAYEDAIKEMGQED